MIDTKCLKCYVRRVNDFKEDFLMSLSTLNNIRTIRKEAREISFEIFEEILEKMKKVHEELLADRVCFIVNPEGEIVATTSAWFKTNGDIRFPLIHWVSTSPKEQGKGLGKAIVLFALSRFLVVEPDADFIFLHTHTWAYKAVGMYQKMGFRITKKALPTSRTDFSCMDVLKDVLPNSIIAQLLEKD